MRKLKNIDILLIIILSVAAFLRLYNISNMHLFNDELSALSRTHYNSFADLINFGIKNNDTHPALIQSFLYFYTKLFGYNDVVVKLPFILMSITSVYFIFRISEKFFNKTTGYLTISLFSTMQYAVWYGQTARPYSAGLFFIVMAVYFWQDFIIDKKIENKTAIGYVIFMSLATYNHYFSLLTALIIGIIGLFFIKKEIFKKYILINISIIILFIPHIGITLHHLSLKGLQWLSVPTSEFFYQYSGYIFNYCRLIAIITLIIFISSLFIKSDKKIKYSFILLLFFVIPFAIEYFYSIYKFPVLQFAGLIFSIPFFYIFLFSFVKEQNQKINFILSLIILSIGTYSLVVNRQHYKVTYNSKFYNAALETKEDINKYGYDKYEVAYKLYGNFYITKYLDELDVDTTIIKANYLNQYSILKDLKKKVYASKADYFAYGNLLSDADLINLNIIKEKYPFLIKTTDKYFLFSKIKEEEVKKSNVLDTVFTTEVKLDINNKSVHYDSLEQKYYFDYTNTEWGPDLSFIFDSIINHKNNILVITAKIKTFDNNDNVKLATDISLNDSTTYWSDRDLDEFRLKNDNFVYLHNLSLLQDIETKHCNNKVFLWNKTKKGIKLYNLRYTILQGYKNPYGLYWNLEKN